LEKEGIKLTVIKAGKHKAEGVMGMPLSDEAKAAMKARVEAAYGMFTRDVAKGREVTPAAVRDGFGEGRLLMGVEAKKAGLIDHIGTLESSIARLVGRKSAGGMRAEGDAPALETELDPAAAEAAVADAFSEMVTRLERY
jgi:ClpP class serine protease